jgi:hypothetical protein
MATGIFDLNTSLQFFDSICRTLERYKSNNAKDIEDLLYVIMGLNHLREWIAPKYERRDSSNPSKDFYQNIFYNSNSYKLIKDLCNRTKHLEMKAPRTTSAQYGLSVDDWPDVDAVRDFDLGPASDYFVDGKNIIEIIDEIVAFYENNWFNLLNKKP